jgi:hypothetical protein
MPHREVLTQFHSPQGATHGVGGGGGRGTSARRLCDSYGLIATHKCGAVPRGHCGASACTWWTPGTVHAKNGLMTVITWARYKSTRIQLLEIMTNLGKTLVSGWMILILTVVSNNLKFVIKQTIIRTTKYTAYKNLKIRTRSAPFWSDFSVD